MNRLEKEYNKHDKILHLEKFSKKLKPLMYKEYGTNYKGELSLTTPPKIKNGTFYEKAFADFIKDENLNFKQQVVFNKYPDFEGSDFNIEIKSTSDSTLSYIKPNGEESSRNGFTSTPFSTTKHIIDCIEQGSNDWLITPHVFMAFKADGNFLIPHSIHKFYIWSGAKLNKHKNGLYLYGAKHRFEVGDIYKNDPQILVSSALDFLEKNPLISKSLITKANNNCLREFDIELSEIKNIYNKNYECPNREADKDLLTQLEDLQNLIEKYNQKFLK